MSQSTHSVTGEQGVGRTETIQVVSIPAPTADQLAASAEARTAAQAIAAKLLDEMASFIRDAEGTLAEGYFAAGEKAHAYIKARLALGDNRAAAVKAIEGKLSEYASFEVNANDLIGAYFAWQLFGNGKTPEVGYTHYRLAFSKLVRRVNEGTADEAWEVLPHVADEARACYSHCVTNKLSVKASAERCQGVFKDYLAAESEARRAEETRLKAEKAEAARVKAEAEAAAKDAATVAQAAQEAAAKATDEAEKAKAAEAAEKAKAEAAAARQAAAKAKADAESVAKAAEAARKGAERTEKRLDKLTRPKPERKPITDNLQGASAPTDPVALAQLMHDLLLGCDDAEKAFSTFLAKVKADAHFSRRIHRACDAGLVTFDRKDKPAPAPAPSTNGVAVAAA